MDVQVFPDFRRELPVRWLREVAKTALSHGIYATATDTNNNGATHSSMSLVIADDETVQGLNRDYRGLDETTDVLAFSSQHSGHYEGDGPPPDVESHGPFITPEDDGFVGEVVISHPQCLKQAKAQGRSPRDELALLIVHGVLHLLGYDHLEPYDEREMQALEKTCLADVGIQGLRP
ncbi:MAG: rRNA maturation RNase YbeY [Chloroflexi bacterium]|nr:rRNA maturation RNase YbeY [Chloroflexota bacterium]